MFRLSLRFFPQCLGIERMVFILIISHACFALVIILVVI
jgi:hypothetical protein